MQPNVLIVDDSKAMLGIIAATFRELGIDTLTCVDSGEDAFALIEERITAFQLVIVDLNMPGMDGVELINRLSHRQFPGGVVILSELDNKIVQLAGDVTREHKLHLIGCVNKPVSQDKISAILQKLRSLRRREFLPDNRLGIEQIREAIDQRRLVPYYQPKVDNRHGRVTSLEILSRLVLPGEADAITSNRFIPVAEDNGLVEELTLTLLDSALSEYGALSKAFGANIRISLNVSPLILNDASLPGKLLDLLARRQAGPDRLILEITESHAIESTLQFETLNRLRIKGFDLALDDYGTGFTNIQQLKSLPYTEIKIDRSLIYNIANDKLSQVVAHSLFDIFDELNVEVVAEGIETPQDLAYLNNLPIPISLQGYIISKPKPLEGICRWHRSWKKVIE